MDASILQKALDLLPKHLAPGDGSVYRISEAALADYNEQKGTVFKRDTLTNAQGRLVAEFLMLKIIIAYSENGITQEALGPLEFVSVVALGYIAGWGKQKGTLAVLAHLQENNAPVTLNAVWEAAKTVPVISSLRQKSRYGRARAFANDLLAAYMRQDTPKKLPGKTFVPTSKPTNKVWLALLSLPFGLALWQWHRKRKRKAARVF